MNVVGDWKPKTTLQRPSKTFASLILFSVRRTHRSSAKFATFSSGKNR